MSEERLKEIKDNIGIQLFSIKNVHLDEKIISEKWELYNEVVRLREIIDKTAEYCNNNIEFTPRLIDVIDMLRAKNLTLEQLNGVENE